MVSDIKGPRSTGAQPIDIRTNKANSSATTQAAPGAASEVVRLTDLAARLKQLSETVHDLPVVDQKRVVEFQDAIANGEYELDERAIADKLASLEALLGRGE